MPEGVRITYRLNGEERRHEVAPGLALIELLRGEEGLIGPKLACARAVCGSCTVLLDGLPAASCAVFAWAADGAEVTTIEGLALLGGTGAALQAAFAARSAFQCGYCTGGMILLAKALLDREPQPDRATVVEWMSSNICRCTGYELIVEAVLDAARSLEAADV